MPIVIKKLKGSQKASPFLAKDKAKAATKPILDKGKSKAKTAKTSPARKKKLMEALSQKKWEKWEGPSEAMICRLLAGGDQSAGALLHRIAVLWGIRTKKLERFGKEWLAMPRQAWANQAALTEGELKNYALPRLRAYCWEFIDARAMKLREKVVLWIHLDRIGFAEAFKQHPWDMTIPMLGSYGIGLGVPPKNAYAAKSKYNK